MKKKNLKKAKETKETKEMKEIYDEMENLDDPMEASDSDDASLPLEENQTDSLAPVETAPLDPSAEANLEEIDRLQREIVSLREALAKKEAEETRALSELEEFGRLFPSVSVKNLPDEVLSSLGKGIPLAAAYALYEKKSEMARLSAEAINRANAKKSAGRAGTDTAGEYFSPDEVRAMSQKQVRANYTRIRESMKHWN